MSEFVAGAFVDVKPSLKGFRTDLKKQLDSTVQKQGALKVPVELDIKRLKSSIASQVRAAKVQIPVEPKIDAATFRKAVLDKIKTATKGLTVKIPIEAGTARKGRAGAAAKPSVPSDPPGQIPLPGLQRGVQSQLAGQESALRAVTAEKEKAARATSKLTEEEKRAVSVSKTLTDVDKKLAVSKRNVADASAQGLPAEEKAARLADARSASQAAVRRATDALATSSNNLTATQRRSLETALAEARASRSSVVEKQKLAGVVRTNAALEEKITKARVLAQSALSGEIKGIQKASNLHVIENNLLAAEARLKALTNKARDAGLNGRVRENQALLREIDLRKKAIAARRDELRGEGKRITQNKTAARGAISTILSLLGIRGATLAASGAFLAGAAAASIFTKSLGAFASLETELNVFQAITGATADQMRDVGRAAQELGRDVTLPSVTAGDAAQAMTELSRAGLDVQDSIQGARGVLELAAAAQISNAEAATFAASALNAFGLSGDKATHVADLLANAANAAQGSIAEMGAAMQQASAIARQVGLTLDDTVAILTLFARNGLRGSDAGTSLRTALSRLVAPTKDAAILLDQLGINVRNAQGEIRPDVFAQFGEATATIPPALRDMIAQTIAGQDAIRAFSIGAREGRRGLKSMQLQMEAQGTAAQVAAARSKGLAGAFSALGSNAQTLGTQIGKGLAPAVKIAATEVNNLLVNLNQLGSGDFGGFTKDVENDSRQFAANLERFGAGLQKVFGSGATLNFDQFKQGLSEVFSHAPAVDQTQQRIDALLTSLDTLQKLRLQTFETGDAGGNLPEITAEIQRIRAELKAAKIDAGLLIPVTPLEKSLQPMRETLKAAQDFRADIVSDQGVPPEFIDNIIREMRARIKLRIAAAKKDVEKAFSGTDIAEGFRDTFNLIAKTPELATPDVLAGIDDMIRKIRGRAPLAGKQGQVLGRQVVKSLQDAIDAAVKADDPELAAALKAKADKITALFANIFADSFRNIKVPLTGDQIAEALLPGQIASARAEAFGTIQEQLDAKEAELADLKKQLGQVVKGSEEEKGVLNDITSKKSEIEGLRESQAQEQRDRTEKADKVVLDAISAQERKRQNALIIAQESESLADDIAAQRKLRSFYVAKIKEVKATVRDAETRADQLSSLNQELFDIERDIAEDVRGRRKQIRDARVEIFDEAAETASETETLADDQRTANRKVAFWRKQVRIVKQLVRDRKATAAELQEVIDELEEAEDEAKQIRRNRRQQTRDNRAERLDLKIQIAQDNGNVQAEIAARNAQIRNTQALIRQTRKGSLQRLRLIAQLRKEQRELRELKEEKEKTTNEAKQVIFAFMQAQQGFAANLLSNLVPFNIADGTLGQGPVLGGGGGGASAGVSTQSGIDPDILKGIQGFGGGLGEANLRDRPDEGLARQAAIGAASKTQGFTGSQATRLIKLTEQIVTLLGGASRRSAHPATKSQNRRSDGSMDVM